MTRKFKYVNDGCDPKSATTLDQLFGNKRQLNLPYKKLPELEAALKRMNLVDMQSLAITLGIKPCSERIRLSRACVDQFERLTKTYGFAKKIKPEDEELFDPAAF